MRAGATVSEMCDWYLEEARAGRLLSRNRQPMKASSLQVDESRIKEHIKPLLGARAIRAITLADIERLQADIAAGKSAASKRRKGRGGNTRGGAGAASRCVATLRAIFGHAVRWGLIGANPALGVRQLPLERRTRRLSEAEIVRLGETMRSREYEADLPAGLASIQLILLTGFRRSEALGLRYAWLDAHCVRFPDTKTGKQLRIIGQTAKALVDLQRQTPDRDYVFPSERNDGHLIAADRVLQRLCVTAELSGVSLHTLRHTFASVAADLGYTELTIAGLLGHAAQGVTQRYVHVDRALVMAADHISAHIADLLGLKVIDQQPSVEPVATQVHREALSPPRELNGHAMPRPIELATRGPAASAISDATPLRPIRNDVDYDEAASAYRRYLSAAPLPGTEAANRAEVLRLLICTYEEARRPAANHPAAALIRVMDSQGKTERDLAMLVGAIGASEILSGARTLTVDHLRQLRSEWGVPAASLV